MATRLCVHCGQHKTIRGVWYLTPAPGPGPSPFICETCFAGGSALLGSA